jgi:hypothetical protein
LCRSSLKLSYQKLLKKTAAKNVEFHDAGVSFIEPDAGKSAPKNSGKIQKGKIFMKIKYVILIALILAITTSMSLAQSKAKTAAGPDAVVKNLYAAQKADKSPFFQTKNRALVEQYFVKDLADMIWKDASDAKGEVGAIDFDPLFNSQDPQITNLVVGKPRKAGGAGYAYVTVAFKNGGKADKVEYELARGTDKKWKIAGIYYSDGEDLASTLRYAQDAEIRKEYDNQPFKGEYLVGTRKCTFTPTKGGFTTRVECDGEEGFKLYQFDGTQTENIFVYMDEKDAVKGKFVFKNGQTDGKFTDASGKEVKVTPIK